MSTMTEIVTTESKRLVTLDIPYLFIHPVEGSPVVIVDRGTMDRVVTDRIRGQFVCADKGSWSACFFDADGMQRYRDHLTESKAYRMVLGYPIGRQPIHTRYAGQIPVRRTAKRSRRPVH